MWNLCIVVHHPYNLFVYLHFAYFPHNPTCQNIYSLKHTTTGKKNKIKLCLALSKDKLRQDFKKKRQRGKNAWPYRKHCDGLNRYQLVQELPQNGMFLSENIGQKPVQKFTIYIYELLKHLYNSFIYFALLTQLQEIHSCVSQVQYNDCVSFVAQKWLNKTHQYGACIQIFPIFSKKKGLTSVMFILPCILFYSISPWRGLNFFPKSSKTSIHIVTSHIFYHTKESYT